MYVNICMYITALIYYRFEYIAQTSLRHGIASYISGGCLLYKFNLLLLHTHAHSLHAIVAHL